MIKKRILRESARVDTAKYGKYGYGGNNRTEQISEILESNGFHSQFITLNHPTKLINRLKNAWLLKNKYNFRFKKSKFLIGYIGHVFENYLHEFKNFEGERIFIQEEPPSFLAYHAAKMCGFKIITMPHNIETMMYGYNEDFFTKEEFPLNVYNELKFIGVSDLVFCISREEQ